MWFRDRSFSLQAAICMFVRRFPTARSARLFIARGRRCMGDEQCRRRTTAGPAAAILPGGALGEGRYSVMSGRPRDLGDPEAANPRLRRGGRHRARPLWKAAGRRPRVGLQRVGSSSTAYQPSRALPKAFRGSPVTHDGMTGGSRTLANVGLGAPQTVRSRSRAHGDSARDRTAHGNQREHAAV